MRNIIDKLDNKNIISDIEETHNGINVYIGNESK